MLIIASGLVAFGLALAGPVQAETRPEIMPQSMIGKQDAVAVRGAVVMSRSEALRD